MKCAVAIVLALVGAVVSNPVPPMGYDLPATSYSQSYVNHGLTYPRMVVTAPIVHRVISTPIITAPIIKTPIITTPIIKTPIISTPIIKTPILSSWGYGDYGLAKTYGGYGLGGYGLGGNGMGGHGLGGYSLGDYGYGKYH